MAAGETVVAGAPIAERLRDPVLMDQVVPASADPRPGGRTDDGELLFVWRDRWRVAGGEVTETFDSPVTGIVREVRPGSAIVIQANGRALNGIVALGGPSRGRLHIAAGSDGELRSGGLDVGLAGTILVVGSRIDAETLTRARAMGVNGIVVGGLASKERRDFTASERRQRAALHRLAPYAVLVLEGATRRPLPSPVMDVLEALAGPGGGDRRQPADARVRERGGRAATPSGLRACAWRPPRRPRRDLGRVGRAAPVRGRGASRGGRGALRRRDGDGGATRRPRTVHLTAMPSSTADRRLVMAPDPAATSALGRALGAVARGR